jgi:chitosanase
MYVDAGGQFAADLASYADRVGSSPLVDDPVFKDLLRKAGRQDPTMKRIQDQLFDQRYFQPAMGWADEQGFTKALSGLVIYDSFIHSGSILWIIRSMFSESPPTAGGSEEIWIRQYVNARHRWLSRHPRSIIQATIYRTACFKREMARSNWDLSILPINANGVPVS